MEVAAKVRKAGPSGLKPLGMTKNKRLNGTTEVVPRYETIAEANFSAISSAATLILRGL
jgi:hypothetical protein